VEIVAIQNIGETTEFGAHEMGVFRQETVDIREMFALGSS